MHSCKSKKHLTVFFMMKNPNLKDTMMDAASSETNDKGEIRILKLLP